MRIPKGRVLANRGADRLPMAKPVVDVLRQSRKWNALPSATLLVRKAVQAALASAPVASGSGPLLVSLCLSDDARVRALNAGYRAKNKPTNVLSFPAPKPRARRPMGAERFLGDVILAFETVEREAVEQGKSLAAHVTHLVVHGTLHLVGHDHETEAEAERMESVERSILAGMGYPDPYAEAPASTPGLA
jgi:probable rRNA maturation factor